MTAETITDYKTEEVQREVRYCDFPGCVQDSDETTVTTVAKNAKGENTDLCEQHYNELFGGDNLRVTENGVEVIEEKNPLITMPWDRWSLGGFYKDHADGGLVMNATFGWAILPLQAIMVDGNSKEYNQGSAMAARVVLIYFAISFAVWWFVF